MNALFWALQAVVIAFALLSFKPLLAVVLIGKTIFRGLLGIQASGLHAVAGGRGLLYPPLLLLQESAFWAVGAVAFIATFVIRLRHPA